MPRSTLAGAVAVAALLLGLTAPPAAAKFEFVCQFGSRGSGVGQLFTPQGIAVAGPPDNYVFVADTGNHRILRFRRPDGGSPTVIAGGQGTGRGQFNSPESLTVHADELYVPDFNGRIQVFDFNGNYRREWGRAGSGDGEFGVPRGIAVDPANGRVWVADSRNHRVQIFTGEGTFIRKFGRNGGDGTSGTGDGEFRTPAGVALGANVGVGPTFAMVAEEAGARVQQFFPDGGFARKWGSLGAAPGQFNNPDGVAIDRKGRIFVIEPAPAFRVQVFDPGGNLEEVIKGGEGTPAENFSGHDVAVDSEGFLYVVDGEEHRVLVFAEPPADTTAPKIGAFRRTLSTRQRGLRRGGIVLPARLDEAGLLEGSGVIRFRGAATGGGGPGHVSASFKLTSVRRFVEAAKTVKLKLKIRRTARAPIREAFDDGKSVRARVSLRATDISGNRSRALKATIKVLE